MIYCRTISQRVNAVGVLALLVGATLRIREVIIGEPTSQQEIQASEAASIDRLMAENTRYWQPYMTEVGGKPDHAPVMRDMNNSGGWGSFLASKGWTAQDLSRMFMLVAVVGEKWNIRSTVMFYKNPQNPTNPFIFRVSQEPGGLVLIFGLNPYGVRPVSHKGPMEHELSHAIEAWVYFRNNQKTGHLAGGKTIGSSVMAEEATFLSAAEDVEASRAWWMDYYFDVKPSTVDRYIGGASLNTRQEVHAYLISEFLLPKGAEGRGQLLGELCTKNSTCSQRSKRRPRV